MTDPTQQQLRAFVDAALLDLARLRTDDPAAAHARLAVRLTRHTLETLWLPTTRGLDDRHEYDDV